MRMTEQFPKQSKHIKCSDLNGRDRTVTISLITIELLGEDKKPVLYFREEEKGLALNLTNMEYISDAYGDESDDWIGRPVTMYPARTKYRDKMVDCIRVKIEPTSRHGNQAPDPQAPYGYREPEREPNRGAEARHHTRESQDPQSHAQQRQSYPDDGYGGHQNAPHRDDPGYQGR